MADTSDRRLVHTRENVSYFERLGTGVVLGRTLIAMPFHLATSALLLAVVPESRRRGFRLWYSVPLAWIALGTIHGCFDYCLVAAFEWLRVVTVLIALSRAPPSDGERKDPGALRAGDRFVRAEHGRMDSSGSPTRVG